MHGGAGLAIGTGAAIGGESRSTLRRTPIFLDIDVRTRSSAEELIYGAALRVEVEGRTSVAVVPRVQLSRNLGNAPTRVFIGVPFFFAPFSMLGAELGGAISIPLGKSDVSLVPSILVDVWFWGSDLPDDTVVVGLNATLGLELEL